MTKEQSLCDQVKYRLVDFLKAAELPLWGTELTLCPYCGGHVGICENIFWSCPVCNKRGNAVDYVMALEHLDTEWAAVKRICRALQIKITAVPHISRI